MSVTNKTATKNAVKVQTETTKQDDINLSLINHINVLPQGERVKSEITILKTDLNKSVESNTRSFSSYFREFRKEYKKTELLLLSLHKRGRSFNVELIHDIIKNGNDKPVRLASDLIIQERTDSAKRDGKTYTPPQQWSAARVTSAFIRAVETTPKPEKKAKVTTPKSDDNPTF